VQPNTPGQAALLSMSKEVKLVYEAACLKYDACNVSLLDGHDALKNAIVAELKDTTCAHFTCHSYQEQIGASLQSTLFLHDRPLPLSTIASNQLVNANFVFLSACSTASCSDCLPLDKAMHIAARMLIAGFCSVIATMWSTISNGTGPKLTENVYRHLF
jgi:CHAT domain-containing protein